MYLSEKEKIDILIFSDKLKIEYDEINEKIIVYTNKIFIS